MACTSATHCHGPWEEPHENQSVITEWSWNSSIGITSWNNGSNTSFYIWARYTCTLGPLYLYPGPAIPVPWARYTCTLGPLYLYPGPAIPVPWARYTCTPGPLYLYPGLAIPVPWARYTCTLGPLYLYPGPAIPVPWARYTCTLGPLYLYPGPAISLPCDVFRCHVIYLSCRLWKINRWRQPPVVPTCCASPIKSINFPSCMQSHLNIPLLACPRGTQCTLPPPPGQPLVTQRHTYTIMTLPLSLP